MIRVLLIEDDKVISNITKIYLEGQQQEDIQVTCAHSGNEALAAARDRYDVIVMDILLPDTNGVELCKTMRSWHSCPIIFSSCLDNTDTIVHALEMGGDDFIVKPYDNKVLLARILANLRRVSMDQESPPENTYVCGGFVLDAREHCIVRGERRVKLTNIEFRLLSFFVQHPCAYFTAGDLFKQIWGRDSYGDNRTVQVHVHNLRKKIETDPANPVHLVNEWGKGYTFYPWENS